VIIESPVICEYLDDAYPEPRLRPSDPAGRARMRLWTKQLDAGVHAATSVVNNVIAFRYQKLAIGMEELEKLHQKMPDPQSASAVGRMSPRAVDSRPVNYCSGGRTVNRSHNIVCSTSLRFGQPHLGVLLICEAAAWTHTVLASRLY
jgi:hypothetical protein